MIKYHCNHCKIEVDKSECPVCNSRTTVSSQLYWCKHCNIPIYDERCALCNEDAVPFTSDVRPVFPEERLLIEILLDKPLCFINDSVWNGAGNIYYVNGKRLDLKISDAITQDVEKIKQLLAEYQDQNSYEVFDMLIEKWIEANAVHYNFISTEAIQFIIEKSKAFVDGDTNAAFVSFSGGKDSTVVSDLVRRSFGTPSIIHIFGNTTLEFPSTYEYLNRFKKNNRKTPVLVAENKEQDFFSLCDSFGPPSRSLRWCCTIFKTGFIGEKIKRTFGDKKSVLTFYGIRRNESQSRSLYERSSVGKKISKQLVASPIIDWFEYDIWLYILSTKIDFNDAYRWGYTRVGCWCCPNNSQWSEFLCKIYMPDLYKRFYGILYDFASKMGKTDPDDYVSSGGWKARQGGAGVELSAKVPIQFEPCASDQKSFNYHLNKPITPELYELFKPFGALDFSMGKQRLGEVYVLDRNKQPIIKLQGRIGTNDLRISILKTPIANRTKTIEIELKFKCQITKYQLCVGCHACENVCKFGAIKLTKGSNELDYHYSIDEGKCVHCFECINHYQSGCYMRRVLLPRGKDYSDDKRED